MAARTQRCDKAQARARLADAYAQIDQAGLADASSEPSARKAAASAAVLAGIAAADAACCAGLGKRSRSLGQISGQRLVAVQRQADALVSFAESVLAR
jgi:hypothetical protein